MPFLNSSGCSKLIWHRAERLRSFRMAMPLWLKEKAVSEIAADPTC